MPGVLLYKPMLVKAGDLTVDAVLAYHSALQFHGKAYSVHHRFTYLTRNEGEIAPELLTGDGERAARIMVKIHVKSRVFGGYLANS